MQTRPSPDRLLRLDGLRGLAACFISFVFHLRILFSQESNPLNGVPGLGWFQHWGWSMVDLFFVLSGFVFAHCYLDGWRLRAGTTISSFALSRFARLWPLHAVSLACIILILRDAPETTVANAMTSLAMLHVFLPAPTQTLNGPAWSLFRWRCFATPCSSLRRRPVRGRFESALWLRSSPEPIASLR